MTEPTNTDIMAALEAVRSEVTALRSAMERRLDRIDSRLEVHTEMILEIARRLRVLEDART